MTQASGIVHWMALPQPAPNCNTRHTQDDAAVTCVCPLRQCFPPNPGCQALFHATNQPPQSPHRCWSHHTAMAAPTSQPPLSRSTRHTNPGDHVWKLPWCYTHDATAATAAVLSTNPVMGAWWGHTHMLIDTILAASPPAAHCPSLCRVRHSWWAGCEEVSPWADSRHRQQSAMAGGAQVLWAV